MRYPFIAGNWKMYKTIAEARAFAEEFKKIYQPSDVRVAVCAPYPQLPFLVEAFRGTGIGVGAQNVHYEAEGAFTGEISIPMLEEIGVDYCIVGHSERRQYFNESDDTVNRKVKALLETKIVPIVCVGENLQQKDAGYERQLVSEQVKNALHDIPPEKAERVVIAYEPIWAIGTGKVATTEQAEEVCAAIRACIAEVYDDATAAEIRIQYGGSVNAGNAAELFAKPDIDGGLVGGASLKADFGKIVNYK